MDFDIREYLESREIAYWTSGKNVTAGWTNIECVFPGCVDHSNHLGINPQGSAFNCHICATSGFITELIKEIDRCTWRTARQIYEAFLIEEALPEKERPKNLETALPKSCTTDIPTRARNYLKKRRFDPSQIISTYSLRYGGISGPYKFRLIIPYYLDRQLVTFSSLDITGKANTKYKHQKVEDAVIDPAHMLYNIDSVVDKMILVEGITDVWRIGKGCCATAGAIVTPEQINLIVRKGVKRVLVLFDSDAVDKGKKLAKQLSIIIPSVLYADYDDLWNGDPDDLPQNIVESLRKDFF